MTSSSHGAPGAGVPAQKPLVHVSFVVQGLKSSHEPPVCGVPKQKPLVHVSFAVQGFESSQGSALGVAMHCPAGEQTSSVQGFESALHVVPGSASDPPPQVVPAHTVSSVQSLWSSHDEPGCTAV